MATFSYWCWYKSGKVKLGKDLTEYAWIPAAKANTYDFISDIGKEIKAVDRLLRK